MTLHKPITKATFEFTNRDGIPTVLVVTPPKDEEATASVIVSEDGMSVDVAFQVEMDNIVPVNWVYAGTETEDLVAPVVEDGQGGVKRPELGPVGKAVVSVVLLAILAPVVWIIWDATIRWVNR